MAAGRLMIGQQGCTLLSFFPSKKMLLMWCDLSDAAAARRHRGSSLNRLPPNWQNQHLQRLSERALALLHAP